MCGRRKCRLWRGARDPRMEQPGRGFGPRGLAHPNIFAALIACLMLVESSSRSIVFPLGTVQSSRSKRQSAKSWQPVGQRCACRWSKSVALHQCEGNVCARRAHIRAAHRRIRIVPCITFDKPIMQPLFVGGLFLTYRLTHFANGNKTLGLQLSLAFLCGTKEPSSAFVRT